MGRGKRGKAKKKINMVYTSDTENSLIENSQTKNNSQSVSKNTKIIDNTVKDSYISIYEKRYYVNKFINIYWNRIDAYEPVEDIIIENDSSDDNDELNYEEY